MNDIMNTYYTLYSGDNYDDESIGDERSEEGKQQKQMGEALSVRTEKTPPRDVDLSVL